MPFLRVIRDKRGYETTYLMHWFREGTRQRSRILYIFRSPGGVRVGREPLDPEVLRELEARHPDIDFDWKTVLEHRQVVDTAPDLRRPRKRRREDDRAPAAEAAPAPPQGARPRQDLPSPGVGGGGPAATALARPSIPSAIEGATPDEQIAFLALWYPTVRDRIPQRTSDPGRREALLGLAERLNPASWTDADQIVTGLQQAAESLERLSRVFARRRRRPKRPLIGDRGSGIGDRETASTSLTAVEPPALNGVEARAVSEVEALAMSEGEALAMSEGEPPAISEGEPPAISEGEPPAMSGVEPPTRADAPAQDEQAPAAASGELSRTVVTVASPADE